MTILADLADSNVIFFLATLFCFIVAYYRNQTFQTFVDSFYKNYLQNFNVLPLFVYISPAFSKLVNVSTTLIKQLSNFIKKK
jgi:hypothetical protein